MIHMGIPARKDAARAWRAARDAPQVAVNTPVRLTPWVRLRCRAHVVEVARVRQIFGHRRFIRVLEHERLLGGSR
jgi:hypothetical protein